MEPVVNVYACVVSSCHKGPFSHRQWRYIQLLPGSTTCTATMMPDQYSPQRSACLCLSMRTVVCRSLYSRLQAIRALLVRCTPPPLMSIECARRFAARPQRAFHEATSICDTSLLVPSNELPSAGVEPDQPIPFVNSRLNRFALSWAIPTHCPSPSMSRSAFEP
jgi:hypothetical protein